jgi:NADH-quinone oxidoreductase subunit N
MMGSGEIGAMLPMILVSAAIIIVVLAATVRRNHTAAMLLTIAGLIASFISLFTSGADYPRNIGILFIIDRYALYFMGLILISSFVVTLMAYSYLRGRSENREEMYIMILLSTLGAMALAAAAHFISFILALETLTVSLYVMIGYLRDEGICLEAAIKYLILAAASSSFLLLGGALIYTETASMAFTEIAGFITGSGIFSGGLFLPAGTALVIVGVGFKLGVVPFHMWTPDVYQGAPAPVTAFVASVSKSAVVALILRYLAITGLQPGSTAAIAIAIIAVLSMFGGNILALMQNNVKRLLAYSSIAHLGYVLVALAALGDIAADAIMFYMTAYSFTIIGAFGLISFISRADSEITSLDDYRGLFWRRPFTAAVLSIMLLSLAGIPLTGGFIGKFFIIGAGISRSLWPLVIVLIVTSAIGLYYYLRVIAYMIAGRPEGEPVKITESLSWVNHLILLVLVGVTVYLGVYPGPIYRLIGNAARLLFL